MVSSSHQAPRCTRTLRSLTASEYNDHEKSSAPTVGKTNRSSSLEEAAASSPSSSSINNRRERLPRRCAATTCSDITSLVRTPDIATTTTRVHSSRRPPKKRPVPTIMDDSGSPASKRHCCSSTTRSLLSTTFVTSPITTSTMVVRGESHPPSAYRVLLAVCLLPNGKPMNVITTVGNESDIVKPDNILSPALCESSPSTAAILAMRDGASFPGTVHRMIESLHESCPSLMSWVHGGTAFVVQRDHEGLEDVLLENFTHSSFKSFHRQLNNYGFIKFRMGPYKGCFYHANFRREMNQRFDQVQKNWPYRKESSLATLLEQEQERLPLRSRSSSRRTVPPTCRSSASHKITHRPSATQKITRRPSASHKRKHDPRGVLESTLPERNCAASHTSAYGGSYSDRFCPQTGRPATLIEQQLNRPPGIKQQDPLSMSRSAATLAFLDSIPQERGHSHQATIRLHAPLRGKTIRQLETLQESTADKKQPEAPYRKRTRLAAAQLPVVILSQDAGVPRQSKSTTPLRTWSKADTLRQLRNRQNTAVSCRDDVAKQPSVTPSPSIATPHHVNPRKNVPLRTWSEAERMRQAMNRQRTTVGFGVDTSQQASADLLAPPHRLDQDSIAPLQTWSKAETMRNSMSRQNMAVARSVYADEIHDDQTMSTPMKALMRGPLQESPFIDGCTVAKRSKDSGSHALPSRIEDLCSPVAVTPKTSTNLNTPRESS